MSTNFQGSLLPIGLSDLLPPDAEYETHITETLMRSFASYGYDRVKPPLIEFEEILLGGSGVATEKQTFRIMDPVSQRMLGVRADMTMQIARIASTRLGDIKRPIRLSYAGQVLRVKGSDLRPKRQFAQIGAELIGSNSFRADAEVILMTINALESVGISNLSVDLCIPKLLTHIFTDFKIDASFEVDNLKTFFNQKNVPAIEGLKEKLGDEAVETFKTILISSGSIETALPMLKSIKLNDQAKKQIDNLEIVVKHLRKRAPDLKITIDPAESRGFEYHTGITFSFFSSQINGEIGRGGRYQAYNSKITEDATGVSLFVDSIIQALPKPKKQKKILVSSFDSSKINNLRKEGWIVVEYFDDVSINSENDTIQSGCTHYWDGQNIIAVNI